ncbi:MAG: hypothetical protein E7620_01640 [Ruminococcaceae bacterium]|nr:hypothetical protein [Oscillospiraceae bacterium]
MENFAGDTITEKTRKENATHERLTGTAAWIPFHFARLLTGREGRLELLKKALQGHGAIWASPQVSFLLRSFCV